MKIRRKNNKLIILFNLIVSVLFLLPIRKLNLFDENYSTLSLTTRGYLYMLFLGIIIGLLLAYETLLISKLSNALFIFMSLIIGTIIPHHIPYNLQGNLHLLFAYIGFACLVIATIINCRIKKYIDIYLLFIFIAIILYLKFGMVNTISEIVVMLGTLFTNMLLVLKKKI